jgi:hypothetical protein
MWGHGMEEITGNWRKLNNEKFHTLYSSPNTVWVVNQGRVRWAVHVGHIEAPDEPINSSTLTWDVQTYMGGCY